MAVSIENYVSQNAVKRRRRQATIVWGATFSAAAIWILLIISAPLAKSGGFEASSNAVYGFFSYLCHQMSWRSYHIGEYSLAVCARCFGFYGGLLLGAAIYPLFRSLDNTEPISRFWLFLAMVPMGVDWSLEFFGVWNNTHFSRLLSGLILGAACVFFIIPALIEISRFFADKVEKRA